LAWPRPGLLAVNGKFYRVACGYTLFVMEPLGVIEAIRMMLPLFPNLAIYLPAACAVNSTPFVLMFIT
jgi:hypothetical protein